MYQQRSNHSRVFVSWHGRTTGWGDLVLCLHKDKSDSSDVICGVTEFNCQCCQWVRTVAIKKIKTDEKQALYYKVLNANLVDTVRIKSAPLWMVPQCSLPKFGNVNEIHFCWSRIDWQRERYMLRNEVWSTITQPIQNRDVPILIDNDSGSIWPQHCKCNGGCKAWHETANVQRRQREVPGKGMLLLWLSHWSQWWEKHQSRRPPSSESLSQ